MKPITSKKQKTDADFEEIAHLEFFGGLYMDENGPVIPADVIDAMVINGAKKSTEGMLAKSGCYCENHAKLEYEGPRTAAELWQDETFRFCKSVKVSMSRVQRTRPIFNKWSAIITLNIDSAVIANAAQVDKWIDSAGTQVGICDWRPKYGRFTSERLNGNH
jgi:hypothetical protein